jgi:hypothetical protein
VTYTIVSQFTANIDIVGVPDGHTLPKDLSIELVNTTNNNTLDDQQNLVAYDGTREILTFNNLTQNHEYEVSFYINNNAEFHQRFHFKTNAIQLSVNSVTSSGAIIDVTGAPYGLALPGDLTVSLKPTSGGDPHTVTLGNYTGFETTSFIFENLENGMEYMVYANDLQFPAFTTLSNI